MGVCRKKDEKIQRRGHASLNLRYRTGNTQVTVSLETAKGYCLSGNKECTGKGSIKLILSVLGELGLTLGDNITELSINVSLALVGIIRSQKARGQVTARKKQSEQNCQNSHHCQN